MSRDSHVDQESRRKFVKTIAYVAPAIVTLSAMPSFASAGSGYQRDGKVSYRRHSPRFHSSHRRGPGSHRRGSGSHRRGD